MRQRYLKAAPSILLAFLLMAGAHALIFGQGPQGQPGAPPPQGPPPFGPDRLPPMIPQGPGMPGGPGMLPPGVAPLPPPPGFNLLSSEMRFGMKLVKGVPFSAQVVNESNQTLGDGTRITHKSTGAIYRDNEGRMRREQTLAAIGPFVPAGDPPQFIFIEDPVGDVRYALDVRQQIAHKLPPPPGPPPTPPAPPESSDVKTESLGTKTIEGVEAEGTRTTITIPAGREGNDRPILIVSERWYAPSLQIVVYSRHSDPHVGENIYRLTNITRSEPERALFQVPADYKIEEGPALAPRPPGRGPRRPDEQ